MARTETMNAGSARILTALVLTVLPAGVMTAAEEAPIGTGLIGIRGYRNDWSGRYPEADPVTAFDLEKGINVLWRVPTSRFGNSTPQILGDRLIFVIEPFTVVCLDKMTGKVLWTSAGSEPAAYEPFFTVDKAAGPWSRRKLKYGEHGGNSYAAPVTDGKRLWFKGRGAARCFDPSNGKELWATDLHLAPGDHPHSVPSPLLVGNVLVCQGGASDYWQQNSTRKLAPGVLPRSKFPKFQQWMVGLDADTGRILWDIGPLNAGGYGVSGAPAPLVLQEGNQRRVYIVAAEGHVIRPEDGKLVLPFVGARNGSTAPVPLGKRLLFANAIVELGLKNRDELAVVKITPVAAEGAPVYHNGLIYSGCRSADRATRLMSVFDTRTGRELYKGIQIGPTGGLHRSAFERADDMDYPTAALAGKFVFFSTSHAIAVADISGARPWPVALNYVERMHIAPVFDGDRMYLRTYDAMTCIARKGEEGARYEREVNARTLMYAFPAKVGGQAAIEPGPVSDPSEWVGSPASMFAPGRMPDQWVFAGPFPKPDDGDALQSIGGCAQARPTLGQQVAYGGKSLAFAAVDPRHLQKDGLHMDALTRKDRGGQSFLFTWLIVGGPEFVACSAVKPGVRVWVGGAEAGPGRVFKLAMGAYPVLIRIAPSEGADKAQEVVVNPAFARSEDPNLTEQKDKALVREGRERLKRVIDTLPGADEARRAEALLKAVE